MERLRPGRGAAAAAALAAAAPPEIETRTPRGESQSCTPRGGPQPGARYVATPRATPRGAPAGGKTEGGGGGVGGVVAAASAAASAAVRQVEQRLEAERRHTDRQLQRLERRLEEVACSVSGGRWAELQGYVDGLAETVQDLVRSVDGAGRGSPTLTEQAVAGAMRPLTERLVAAEARLAHLEEEPEVPLPVTPEPHEGGAVPSSGERRCVVSPGSTLDEEESIDARLERLECIVRGLCAPAVAASVSAAAASAVECGQRLRCGISAGSLSSAGCEPHLHDGTGNLDFLRPPREAEGTGCTQVEALEAEVASWTADFQEQVTQLRERLQEAENGLQDLAHAHEMRQEVEHVGEQVIRLTLQRQRLARGQQPATQEVEVLRRELDGVSEELAELWEKVKEAEGGLDGMANALSRVCGELAELKEHGLDSPSSSEELEASMDGYDMPAGSPSGAAGAAGSEVPLLGASPSEPRRRPQNTRHQQRGSDGMLLRKVEELERSMDAVADVVWELRRSMANVRKAEAEADSVQVLSGGPHKCLSPEPAPVGSAKSSPHGAVAR